MFSSLLAVLPVLAFGIAKVAAQECYYCNQTKPFNLVVESSNNTINGQTLKSCHSGAAIETLCLISGTGSTYYYNYTDSQETSNGASYGYLTYVLRGSNFNVSEPLSLSIDQASNVAIPLLTPSESDAQIVTFSTNSTGDYLAIPSYVDDTVVPATTLDGVALDRWYICQTYFGGYRYTTLAWVLGIAKPQNPSCQKVRVRRVFI